MPLPRLLFPVFMLSGFAGIIYESIWSHYLKLFVGHAAYAQTVVLVLFMGGMAIGASLGARWQSRIRDSLQAYAIVELLIGLIAFSFHGVYTQLVGLINAQVFPLLSSDWSIDTVKFLTCSALLLPQSILLGLTFPLMAVGILQRRLLPAGFTLANLYFVNSLGAAIGVLVSGFILIAWFDLPGTIQVAGALNFVVAAAIVRIVRQTKVAGGGYETTAEAPGSGAARHLMILTAAVTGTASFVYEIVWVRMLNLVLGASTHSFELMLSAFILGLALGGRWIRQRLDHIRNPLRMLGFVQIVMATLAAATLVFYDFSFTLMSAIFLATAPTETGYVAFMLLNSLLVLMIMLPTTICAGMTLPLITHWLLSSGNGERSVGEVYAANTLGAIVGVLLTVHLALPLMNMKGALLLGVSFDLLLGAYLLHRAVGNARSEERTAVIAAIAVIVTIGVAIQLDARVLASSVFRFGKPELRDDAVIDMHRDGKTTTVTVYTFDESHRAIVTNGKVDGSIQLDLDKKPSVDEGTQVLTGVLPFAIRPDIQTAAVIGIGTGMTTHMVLQGPQVEVVDTIEIEAQMVAGARLFLPHVEATFDDPRSKIHIEDARSYFSSRQHDYDLIISEPSNPWVSGISGLFTTEFYSLVRDHLDEAGVFAQWMQLYELDRDLVSSVLKAFSAVFPEHHVFEMGDGNLLLVAGLSDKQKINMDALIQVPGFQQALARIGIRTAGDLGARYVASSRFLREYIAAWQTPANSDFAPILDLRAAYQRFLRRSSRDLSAFVRDSLPIREMLGGAAVSHAGVGAYKATDFSTLTWLSHAAIASHWLLNGSAVNTELLPAALAVNLRTAVNGIDCEDESERRIWLDAVIASAQRVLASMDPAERQQWVTRYLETSCVYAGRDVEWLKPLRAIAERDAGTMAAAAAKLLDANDDQRVEAERAYLVKALFLGNLATGDGAGNTAVWDALEPSVQFSLRDDYALELLRAYSGTRY